MSEAVSALQGKRQDGAVSVHEDGLRGMITLRGDVNDPALHEVAVAITGVDFPARNECTCVGQQGLAWMSPDELMVFVKYDAVGNALEKLEKALSGKHFLCANVSDARAVMIVEGQGCRDVMARLTPADVHAMAPSDFRRSRLAQTPAAFWMRDQTSFEIVCFRSVADYVFGLLANAADAQNG